MATRPLTYTLCLCFHSQSPLLHYTHLLLLPLPSADITRRNQADGTVDELQACQTRVDEACDEREPGSQRGK